MWGRLQWKSNRKANIKSHTSGFVAFQIWNQALTEYLKKHSFHQNIHPARGMHEDLMHSFPEKLKWSDTPFYKCISTKRKLHFKKHLINALCEKSILINQNNPLASKKKKGFLYALVLCSSLCFLITLPISFNIFSMLAVVCNTTLPRRPGMSERTITERTDYSWTLSISALCSFHVLMNP